MKTIVRYRHRLPQQNGALFLTDGGIETCLIFDDGLELPLFAAFPLIRDAQGRRALTQYYERFIEIARRNALGFVLEPDLAGKRRLGREARQLACGNFRCQHRRDRSDAGTAGGPRNPGVAHGRQRLYRAARRRLPNASRRSHQELNDSPDLDAGDPVELGHQYRDIVRANPQINVLGGCCGTDHRHVECIALACKPAR